MRSSDELHLVEALTVLGRQGQLAQALLISVGSERGAVIRDRLARVLLCEQTGEDGCLCRSCQTALDGHPDFIELLPEPRTISKDSVRQAVATLGAGPLWSKAKVIVFNPADTLGREAESYLLKHLEEPPTYAYYLLLTETPDALLGTVRSRCQHWRLGEPESSPPGDIDVAMTMKQESLTPERIIAACYWVRSQYLQTAAPVWLTVWEALQEACAQLEANGNEDLVRARILSVWPYGKSL